MHSRLKFPFLITYHFHTPTGLPSWPFFPCVTLNKPSPYLRSSSQPVKTVLPLSGNTKQPKSQFNSQKRISQKRGVLGSGEGIQPVSHQAFPHPMVQRSWLLTLCCHCRANLLWLAGVLCCSIGVPLQSASDNSSRFPSQTAEPFPFSPRALPYICPS